MIDIIVTNEKALVPRSPEAYSLLAYYLTYTESRCRKDILESRRKKKTVYKWEKVSGSYIEDDGSPFYTIPRGIAELLPTSEFNIIHETTNKVEIPLDLSDNYIKHCLEDDKYSLRDDQIDAVKSSLRYKRGINQLATGSGKSIIICAICKILIDYNPDIRILLVLPYDHLIKAFMEYFDRFYIRYDQKKVKGNITLSSALTMSRRPEQCTEYKAVIYDEVQHAQSGTYFELSKNLVNAEIALGFSAKVISDENVANPNVRRLTPSEGYIIGVTGRVITYAKASKFIDEEILATPVLMTLNNKCDDILEKEFDWARTVKLGIMDPRRTKLAAQIADIFYTEGRRILILAATHKQSYELADAILDQNQSALVGVSHGGNVGYLYSTYPSGNHKVDDSLAGNDIIKMFKEKEINILVGTTHIDEGADLPDLDVCILAGAGKSSRRIIQRVGRSLRISKTGKYAYLIDFCDNNSIILHKHYLERLKVYVQDIGITVDRSYRELELDQIREIFRRLEGLN